MPNLNTVTSFLAQFGLCANLEYGQIISGTVWWVCQFGIRPHNFWHLLVVVPIWNKIKSFLAQFGVCANFEYGHIISGTVWWLCQFGIWSHFWHSKLVVPFWRHLSGHTVHDVQYCNRLDRSLLGRIEIVRSEFYSGRQHMSKGTWGVWSREG